MAAVRPGAGAARDGVNTRELSSTAQSLAAQAAQFTLTHGAGSASPAGRSVFPRATVIPLPGKGAAKAKTLKAVPAKTGTDPAPGRFAEF